MSVTGAAPVTYRRKLSPVERIHAATGHSLFTLDAPRESVFVIEGRGGVDGAALEAAVARAAAANPGTCVTLRRHLRRSRWEASPSDAPRVRVAAEAAWDGWSSDGFETVLGVPLSLRDGPTWEVVLVPGDPTRLVVRAFHAVTDGAGVALFATDVLRCLRGEEPLGSDSTVTDVELMRTVEPGELRIAKGPWQQPTGEPEGTERGDVWRRVHVPGRHSQLFARVVLATARHAWRQGDHPVRFTVPVDLRRHAPGIRSTANLVGLVFLDVPRDATVDSIESSLRDQIERGNHVALPDKADAIAMVPLRFIDFRLGRRPSTYLEHHRGKPSGMISNLGRLDLETLSTPDFRATATFALPVPDNFFVTLAGDVTGANLVVGVPKLFATRGRLEQVCAFLAEDIVGGDAT